MRYEPKQDIDVDEFFKNLPGPDELMERLRAIDKYQKESRESTIIIGENLYTHG